MKNGMENRSCEHRPEEKKSRREEEHDDEEQDGEQKLRT